MTVFFSSGEKDDLTRRSNHRLLIRGMSCIISTVFDNTTANHHRPLGKVPWCHYWALIKYEETRMERALWTAHWFKHREVNEPIYILSAAICVEWRGRCLLLCTVARCCSTQRNGSGPQSLTIINSFKITASERSCMNIVINQTALLVCLIGFNPTSYG